MEMENARVLVADTKIEQMKDILPVLEQVTRNNQPLFIVTEDITGQAARKQICLGFVCVLAAAGHQYSRKLVNSWPLLRITSYCCWHA